MRLGADSCADRRAVCDTPRVKLLCACEEYPNVIIKTRRLNTRVPPYRVVHNHFQGVGSHFRDRGASMVLALVYLSMRSLPLTLQLQTKPGWAEKEEMHQKRISHSTLITID